MNLYLVEGEAMLSRLNGIFTFAIWDQDLRSLLVARDALGQGLLEVCPSSPGWVDALTVLCAGTALNSWLSSPPPRLLLQAI